MRKLKEEAILMKEALLNGELYKMGEILGYGWQLKKLMAGCVSNKAIDEIYDAAMKAGATGGKISGAGGGGFMIFYCPGTSRYSVSRALAKFGGRLERFNFVEEGVIAWKA
jgi:D-glycero-alpha-D-manno-heptose-7-phosphate kinase